MDRRTFIGAATAIGMAAPLRAAERLVTPPQTEGPFYPYERPGIDDNDLVRLRAGDAAALGQVGHVSGTVRDYDGEPIANMLIEIWQCDANGKYHHPDDDAPRTPDPRFQGYGRVLTDREGRFSFRTIRPVAYGIGGGQMRAPHIHLAASSRGVRRLTTQLYVAGEPLNDGDFELAKILPVQRPALIRPWTDGSAIEPGSQMAAYDIVLV